jgi:hypothetical protein
MKNVSLDTLEEYLTQTLDYQMSWHALVRQGEKFVDNLSESSDWERMKTIAHKIPAEWRSAPGSSYRIDNEVGGDQSEGPIYEFDRFLDEVKPLWNLSGLAGFDLTKKSDLWKEFSAKNTIPIWSLTGWKFSGLNINELLSTDLLQRLSGMSLSQIKPGDVDLLKIFQNKEVWQHWEYMAWRWLWGDNPEQLLPWFELLEDTNLKTFELHSSNINKRGWQQLGRLRNFWENITAITLHGVKLGDEEMDDLMAGNPALGQLKSLSLDDSPLSNGGKESLTARQFVAMCRMGWLDKLERLSLYYHRIGREGIQALGESSAVDTLQYMRLSVVNMNDEDLLLLSEIPWKNLNYISLSHNKNISNRGLEVFQQTPLFQKCRYVYIQNSNGPSLSKGSLLS